MIQPIIFCTGYHDMDDTTNLKCKCPNQLGSGERKILENKYTHSTFGVSSV